MNIKVTFFTTLKPMQGRIKTIQYNALRSWQELGIGDIIMFGDEPGVADAAREFGAGHVKIVRRNEYGTVYVNDIFQQADRHASTELLCFINADIILTTGLKKTIEAVGASGLKRFLLTGRRTNLDLSAPIDYRAGWESWLTEYAKANGKLTMPESMDYFVYPKGYWNKYPPFTIGRPRYDNWMIREAKYRGDKVIDATGMVLAVHQNHDYRHIQGAPANSPYDSPESRANIKLYGEKEPCYSTLDADYKLTPGGLVKNRNLTSYRHLIRRIARIGVNE
jgi:hypothetical protein